MKKNWKQRVCGILFLLFCYFITNAQNLLTNNGFEDGTNSWTTASVGGSAATFQVIQSDYYSGSNALKIEITTPGSGAKDISVTQSGFSVQKDLVYLLSFYAKADTSGKLISIKFSSTNTTTYDSSNVYLSTEWKKYEVVFPSPVTTASDIQFSFLLGNVKGVVLLDEVAIEKKGNTWYEGAEYRIDKYRKGYFGIKTIDAGGNPISDSIIIKQIKHEFPWGAAIDLNDRATGNNYSPSVAISAPLDSEVYKTERFAPFLAYQLPAETGKKYKLTVKMSENYHNGANLRLFDVFIDGTRVMQNIDKYVLAGGRYIACDSTVDVTAIDNAIKIEFLAGKDNAAIMGLVLSDSAGNPILRLNCSPGTITTHDGNTYISDLAYIDSYAANPNTTDDDYKKAIMLKYCNYGVCGNQFKWSGIEPNKGVINYTPFDNTLGWFNKVGWDMRAHTLLWGGTSSTDYHELPQWVGQLAPAVMYDTCKMRIQRELTRYKGKVKEYDVINEPLHATYLQSKVGDSINWNCFKWAREADPDARLFINDYNVIEYQGDCDNYTNLIRTLLNHGAPIDGIGCQGHLGTYIDVPAIKSRLDKLSQFGIPIKITEFDMGAMNMTQQQQGIEFAKMMRLSFSHPAIEGFIFWGLQDPGWAESIANFITTDKVPKIAADTVYHLIHEVWNTNLSEKTDTSGEYFYKGFYGDYDVMVKFGETWQKYTISCDKENEGQLFTLKENEGNPLSPKLMKVHMVAPASIELTFDKKMLDPSADFKSFKVFDTVTNTVVSAALKTGDSLTIVLTMKANLKAGYNIPVSYYPGNIKSTDGGILEAFGPVLDDSYSTSFIAASTKYNGKAIAVNFKEPIEIGSATNSNFVLKVNNVTTPVSDFAINNGKDTLFLNIANQIVSNQSTITLSYKPGTLKTTDNLSVVAFINKPVTNTVVVPTMVSAATTKDGGSIQVRFSQPIDETTINAADFKVTVNGAESTISAANSMNSSTKYVELTMETPVPAGVTVSIDYIKGNLASIDEIPVATFNASVTNKVNTGISELSENNQIKLYPNPVSDNLNVANANKFNNISIRNITGQEIYEGEIPSTGEIVINTRDYNAGIYVLILKNNFETQVYKFVKE